MNKNRIQPKDLITVGIFSAIMMVVCFAASMLGFIPIFIPLLSVCVPLVGGIPFMLFLTKAQKFGMVTIMGIIVGILTGLLGMGVWVILTMSVFGLVADLIMRSGEYKSAVKSIIGYGVYSLGMIGNYIPIVFARDSYGEMLLGSGFSQEYVDTMMGYMPDWSLLPLLAASFVSGIVGALIGKALMKKHFVRAGIA